MKDVVILGAGPGGYVAAIRAAQLGLDVVCIDEKYVGGTCLNVGCIPTKTYVAMTDILKKTEEAENFGISVENVSVDFEKMVARKNEVVKKLVSGVEYIFKKRGVEFISGHGEIIDKNHIRVNDEVIETKNIIIATGSEPFIPDFLNIDGFTMTSRELLDQNQSIKDLVIIGGGVIGVEFANIWATLGAKVTIVEMQKQLLPMIDKKMAMRLKTIFKKRGIDVLTGKKVEKAEKGKVILDDGNEILADKMLVAIGRKPHLEGFGLENLGIEMDGKFVKVNEFMQTSIDNVYAIGDILSSPQLAHVASKEGIVAIEHIAGHNTKINYDCIPSAIFTTPEIAVVGKNATDVENAKVGQFPFTANGKALGLGETDGYVKIVANENNIVVGMEIMGPHASDLIHEGALAIEKGLTLEDVAETVHAHPTLSETVMEAAENALGRAIHIV